MAETSEPSKENPEASQENPTLSLSFKIRPTSKLKLAIKALSDSNYNRCGKGMIQVKENTFRITTTNEKTFVLGFLTLEIFGFDRFQVPPPIHKEGDQLDKITKNLTSVADNDTIGIHHVQGSNELCFTIVLLHITDRTVCIVVGQKYRWDYVYDENRRINGMEPGQMHRASFMWPHIQSLKKALPLATGVHFIPLTDPGNSIMLRINLQEVGDLLYNVSGVKCD